MNLQYTLCKWYAYLKYYVLKANILFDGLKSYKRLLIALLLLSPCVWGLNSDSYTEIYITIGYLAVLIAARIYWCVWVGKRLGGGK